MWKPLALVLCLSAACDARQAPGVVPAAAAPAAAPSAATPGAAAAKSTAAPSASKLPPRDWEACPAIARLEPKGEILVVGDIHGDQVRFKRLLVGAGVISLPEGAEASAAKWLAGDALLVLPGDMISKGSEALEVLRLVVALRPLAQAQGGDVVALMGNHEAEFLNDPSTNKVRAFTAELVAAGLDPVAQVQQGGEAPGPFLRCLPVAAVTPDGWFFAHAGDTGAGGAWRSLAELETQVPSAVDAAGTYTVPVLIDDDAGRGLLEGRLNEPGPWWELAGDTYDQSKARFELMLASLGARHLVMGHQGGKRSFGGENGVQRKGGEAFQVYGGQLFLTDVGMTGADKSEGALFRIQRDGARVEVVCPNGVAQDLWPVAANPEHHGIRCP